LRCSDTPDLQIFQEITIGERAVCVSRNDNVSVDTRIHWMVNGVGRALLAATVSQ